MTSISDFFDIFNKLSSVEFKVNDLLDILLVAFVIYQAIKLIRDSRAFQLVKGVIFLAAFYFIVYMANMQTSVYMFKIIFQNIILILILVFQPEIRQVIEHLGKTKVKNLGSLFKAYSGGTSEDVSNAINEICKAAGEMSSTRTGALIVMEKETLLGDIANSGTTVDAVVSEQLIGNIFYPKSPLHDGAAIIRDGRVLAAGCVLPLTKRLDVPSHFGTRHRAAIGMSEVSDAMVVVVSEETGIISVARGGKLTSDFTESELREKLTGYLIEAPAESKGKTFRFKKGKENEKNQ